MQKQLFGILDNGQEVYLCKITDKNIKLEIITFGAIIRNFEAYGKKIVGGFDTLSDYIADTSHQGGIIGRVANRIEGASFEIDAKEYKLPKNDGENCLHGGVGFDRRVWNIEEFDESSITLSYLSKNGEEGFPGDLLIHVKYTVSDDALIIQYKAKPYSKTPISLTNHAYFNLDGFSDTVLSHSLMINSEEYTEVNENLIPTGRHIPTKNSDFDFTAMRKICNSSEKEFKGYDHNFIISPKSYSSFLGIKLPLAAVARGRELTLSAYTDCPGVQLYTGNFLGDGPCFFGNINQVRFGAFCLEAQTEPNSVKHGECIYDSNQIYTQNTVYKITKNV